MKKSVMITINNPVTRVRIIVGPNMLLISELEHCYKHACIALGLVNKLKPGAFRAKHSSNVMRRLQAFRAVMLKKDLL